MNTKPQRLPTSDSAVPVPNSHEVRIRPLHNVFSPELVVAECVCGYRSPRMKEPEAIKSGDQHIAAKTAFTDTCPYAEKPAGGADHG